MESINKDLWPIVYSYLGRNETHMMCLEWPIVLEIIPTYALRAASVCGELSVFIKFHDDYADTEIIGNIIKYEHEHLFRFIDPEQIASIDIDIMIGMAIKFDRPRSLQYMYNILNIKLETAHANRAVQYGAIKCLRVMFLLDIEENINWYYMIQIAVVYEQFELIPIINSYHPIDPAKLENGYDDIISLKLDKV